jgi:hypothetical protein
MSPSSTQRSWIDWFAPVRRGERCRFRAHRPRGPKATAFIDLSQSIDGATLIGIGSTQTITVLNLLVASLAKSR